MIILVLRTDKPESEIGLYDNQTPLANISWEAHRQLAETVHIKMKDMFDVHKKTWADIDGIVVYQGPGSFTGLRIGISVANALAYSNSIPIVATQGDTWVTEGIQLLLESKGSHHVVPFYGSDAHITQPKK